MKKLRLHFRVITPPGERGGEMLQIAQSAWSPADIKVELATMLPLAGVDDFSAKLRNSAGFRPLLAAGRSGIGATDVVVYFVRTLGEGGDGLPVAGWSSPNPVSWGSPAPQSGFPATVVLSTNAGTDTLAHELGHLLGLDHAVPSDRLMNDSNQRTGVVLTDDEIAKAQKSPLLSAA